MRKDNPACYECPKAKNTIHWWIITYGIAKCQYCGLTLSKEDTEDMKRD